VLDGGDWSPSCPGHFSPGEKAPGTQDPFDGRRLDGSERRSGRSGEEREYLLLPGIESRSSSLQLSHCTDRATRAHGIRERNLIASPSMKHETVLSQANDSLLEVRVAVIHETCIYERAVCNGACAF
jgi:hypothetical protein